MTKNILEAIRDEKLLGHGFKKKWLKGDSWAAWRSFLSACFGLAFENEAALETFRKCTQRVDAPTKQFREAYLICGRRSGKSFLTAAVATYIAAFRDHTPYLSPGEVGVVAIVAADKAQAAILLRYIRGFFESSAVLRSMLTSDLKEVIALKNGIEISVLTADYRSVRGRTLCACLVDELAFISSAEGAANPAEALLEALRPGLISIPDSILIGLSSPYAKKGALYSIYKENFGKNESDVLVWQAPSDVMNPSLSKLSIASAFLRDPTSARSEYGAQFRDDISGFLTQELLDAVVARDRTALPKQANVTNYYAFCDPSGGKNDSMTLGISHLDGEKAVLDVLVERAAPFSPESVVEEFCAVLKSFGVSSVVDDKYAASWVSEQFAKRGVSYEASERSRSQIYLELLPAIVSQQVELLDHPKLISQFIGLERKTGRTADIVDHGVGLHDDVCNACAGAVVLALEDAGGFGVLDLHASGRWLELLTDGAIHAYNAVRDVFGHAIESPRNENAHAKELREQEIRLRGLQAVQLNPVTRALWEQPPVGPCPRCKEKITILVGGGMAHCNACSHQWWPGQPPEVIFAGRDGLISRRVK